MKKSSLCSMVSRNRHSILHGSGGSGGGLVSRGPFPKGWARTPAMVATLERQGYSFYEPHSGLCRSAYCRSRPNVVRLNVVRLNVVRLSVVRINVALGYMSFGLMSFGLLSFGLMSFGLLSVYCLIVWVQFVVNLFNANGATIFAAVCGKPVSMKME